MYTLDFGIGKGLYFNPAVWVLRINFVASKLPFTVCVSDYVLCCQLKCLLSDSSVSEEAQECVRGIREAGEPEGNRKGGRTGDNATNTEDYLRSVGVWISYWWALSGYH